MGLSSGYKLTEGGILPEEWEYLPIAEVARLESGHTPSKRVAGYWNGEVPWVSLHDTEALERTEIRATAKTISHAGVQNSSARLLPAGTVVFSRTATVGKASIMGRPMATSQDFANYVCGPKLHNRYLVYLLREMKATWRQLMAGSIHNTIYMPAFESLRIVLPPLEEQRAIADALSEVDLLLDGLTRLIAKKRDLKQAAMQQLITGQSRLPGFSGTWRIRPVADMGNVLAGKALDIRGAGTSRKYLRTKNVLDGRIDLDDVLEMPMTDSEFSRFRIEHGDVLLNEGQSLELVGRCAMYRGELGAPCGIQNQLLRFRACPGTSSEFAEHLFRHCQQSGVFAAIATQTTSIAHLGVARFPDLLLSWPSDPEEQSAIAAVLSDMDTELACARCPYGLICPN